MSYTYLIINLLVVLPPLAMSFDKKVYFKQYWRSLFPGMIITAIGFLIWDEWFTRNGYWGFNNDYLTGLYLGHLPVEEIMFFFTIPYACVFLYACMNAYFPWNNPSSKWLWLLRVLGVIFLSIGLANYSLPYTVITFTLLGTAIIAFSSIPQNNWLIRFFRAFVLVIPFFFVVNGLLTGTGVEAPVVWYNPEVFSGIRMLTIPVEDVFYGCLLLILNTGFMELRRF